MKTKETMGITIISLVITIIILLILSGVTISIIVGENGILTKARLAKQMSEVSSEKEAIQLDVTLANMENILDTSNKYYLGIPLYDKTLENGNKWNIIVENESQTIYGTGWNYIDKKWYYFNNSGVMAKDKWIGDYYVDKYGVMTKTK